MAEFAASAAPRSIDQVAELKVSLADIRPPIWRRVQLPVMAGLGDLHGVIQVLFGWDGDHLHVFRELATRLPELVYRNPERIKRAWEQMREGRAAFVEFFGGDELVLPPAEAEERLNAYYRHRQEAALARRPARLRLRHLPGVDVPAFEFPPELADADTIGMIYDETEGSTSTTSTGCCASCSLSRLSRPTSDTLTRCEGTCGRRRLARCRSAA